jgi:uncharacterized protein YyaL (SSP411 family)
MKLIFLILFTLALLSANHISWLGNYDKALEIAKKEHKPLMVLLVKKDCKKCANVIRDNFTNRAEVDILNREYIAVIVTYESKESYPIEALYSTTFPTLFFIDSKSELLLKEPIYY